MNGDIQIQAGKQAKVMGSDLITPRANRIDIEGAAVKVEAGKDLINTSERHEYQQSGLTLAVSTPVTDMAQAAYNSIKRSEQVTNPKLKALYAMKAAEEVAMAAQNVGKVAETLDALRSGQMQGTGTTASPSVKISVSYGNQKQTQTSESQSISHQKSTLSTGTLNVKARDEKLSFEGVDANAKLMALSGKQGIEIKGVKDEEHQRTKNQSVGGSVGVFVGMNGNSYGFGIEGSVNAAKGKSNSDSERWQNSRLNADKLITNSEEGGLSLDAANIKAKRWEAELQSLTLTSRQDTEKYDSKQVSAGASGSIAYGSGGGASVNAAYSKARVDYAQVREQTGIQVGEGGMNATIHNHTQLNGAIIESEASQEKNRFKTGSISHTDIENRSEIKTESASISAGSGGINPMQAISSALSLLGNSHESERSTTKSAISENIHIDTETPENLTALSRDTKNANQQVDKQDLQKVQERQEMAKVIGEISNNAISLATYNEREKINKLGLEKFKLEEQKKALGDNDTNRAQVAALDKQIGSITQEINKTQQKIDNNVGIGSPNGMAIRAVTAALQAAAQNDTNGAIVALASPYLNKKIHEMTDGDTAKDKAANLAAHALLSAVEFQVTGKDPLTGAIAGVTGEATATILTKALYDKTPDQLTASEKENISTLSQLAGGLAGALTAKANGSTDQQGGRFLAATAGADTAKRAMENNFLLNKYSEKKLNAKEKALFDKLKAYGVEDVDKYQEAFNKAETPEERDKIIAQYQAAERRGSEIVFGMYKSGELTEQEYHLLKTSFINQKMLDGAKDGQIANKGQSKAGFLETSPYGYYGHRLTTMGALQDAYLVEAEKVFSDRQVSSGRMTPEERETYLQRLDMSSQMASPLTPDMLRNTIDNPVETVINLVVGKAVGKAMSGSKTAPSSTTKKVDDVGPLEVNNKVNDKSSAMSNIDGYANINAQGYPATSNKTRAQLKAELAFKDANILTVDGKLTDVAINNSRIINLTDGVIKNPSIVKILTKDGSRIEDWKKMTTESIKLSNGQSLQIHFYKNVKTGKVDYETKDFKVKGVVKP